MLIYGTISAINEEDYTVKLICEEYDNFETPWLIIPQLWSVENKSGYLPELKTLAAAYLNEEMTDGFLVSAKYNDNDIILTEFKGKNYIRFSDGVTICHTPKSKSLEITAENLIVNGNISCSGNIYDKKGSMQNIRDWANSHAHTNGNNGSNTGTPTSQI